MVFGIALLAKDNSEGLNRNEINGLLSLMEGDSYYPIELCDKNSEFVAMGFITSKAAKSMKCSYRGLHSFVSEILNGVKDKSNDCRYNFKGIDVWMCFDSLNLETRKGYDVMIKEALFTSVWDDGIEVTAKCKVNVETKEVYDIEQSEVSGLEILQEEYITIDGVDYSVSQDGEDDTEYWYE